MNRYFNLIDQNINPVTLVVGGSGSGKTASVAAVHAVMATERNESFLFTDAYNEIYPLLAKLLKKRKYTVKVINLIEFQKDDVHFDSASSCFINHDLLEKFDIDLKREKVAYFIVNFDNLIPNSINTVQTYCGLLIEEMLDFFIHQERSLTQKRMNFILDDFWLIGRINNFALKLEECKSCCNITMSLTSITDLEMFYPDKEDGRYIIETKCTSIFIAAFHCLETKRYFENHFDENLTRLRSWNCRYILIYNEITEYFEIAEMRHVMQHPCMEFLSKDDYNSTKLNCDVEGM